MKLSEKLKEELEQKPEGVYAPDYYRYLGYQKNLSAPMPILRANEVQALFTEGTHYIHVSDLIVGNVKSLYTTVNETTLAHAKSLVKSFGRRDFARNYDHYAPNYRHTMTVGIPGLMKEIDASLQVHAEDSRRCETLQSMRITIEAFRQMIAGYAARAEELKSDPAYNKQRLDFIIENCNALVTGAPQTFAQALQLTWFCHTAFLLEGRYAMALGRIDQYLYPFFKKDLEEGRLTQEQAITLLENTFMKIQNDIVNICIGGTSPDESCDINDLSYCVLRAVRNCNIPGPNLSARISANTPDDFLDECLKSIGTGLGYPALMNDEVNIASLKRYDYAEEDIYDYSMVGCIENFITGKQPPWSDGRFDAPRYIDYVLRNGVSEYNGTVGLSLGEADTIQSMDEFMNRFEKQLAHGVEEYCVKFCNYNASINPRHYTSPFLSCFCHDCIGRGLDINEGGSIYPSVHGAALMGIGTISDSLAAIEKVIFIDREATLPELRDALYHNFEGCEDLRQKLLAAPKYGNNDDFADKYAVWFQQFLSSEFYKYKTPDGGGMYIGMASNISNIHAGKIISATPDGRKAGEPLSDAASPTYGRDTNGITSTLNSLAKPDYTTVALGSVINQKFSPDMFSDSNRGLLLALIKTYFQKGGQEIQINATSRRVLQDAMEHPENYRNLVVRVSGFSAYYVTLDKPVQLDILSRTQQKLT